MARARRESLAGHTDAFARTVEQALEHYGDIDWLSAHSPLASPYFIGRVLAQHPGDAVTARGQALQEALMAASLQLGSEDQALLRVSFFKRDRYLTNIGIARVLNESRASYYRHRKEAIDALSAALNRSVAPPLRPEAPQARPMIGREAVAAACLADLRAGRSVAITGMGGMGKTTLGLSLIQGWGVGRAFWHTVRPGLNDHADGLIFALAYFLHGLGASSAWQQWVADRGELRLPQMLGLLRHDFASLRPPPLVCIDEVDLLNADRPQHAQVIHLIEELCELAPMLIIGQRLSIPTSSHQALVGLTRAELTVLVQHKGADELSDAEQGHLAAATRGNPALVNLILALRRSGEALDDLLHGLSNAPAMEVLLNRMWQRMGADERLVLGALSVFRGAAPADAWRDDVATAIVDQLLARDLIFADDLSGLLLPPYVREFVERQLTPEARIALHLNAAQVREARAEFTEAAFHYLHGRRPDMAVWVWFAHQAVEIEKGHAAAARAIFGDAGGVALDDLDHADDRRALMLIRGQLAHMVGQVERAEQALGAVSWPPGHPMTARALELLGNTLESRGQLDQAVQHYRQAIDSFLTTPDAMRTKMFAQIGHVHLIRERNFDAARRDATLAHVEVERLQGHIEEESGRLAEAQIHYETALKQCENGGSGMSLALRRTHSDLGRVLFKLGDTDGAITHHKRAIELSESLGRPIDVVIDRWNLSGAFIVAGQHESALEQARLGLELAEPIRDAYSVAGLASNAGEACYYLGRLDEAERFALQSLRQEEDSQRPYALTVLGFVRRDQARWSEAESVLKEAIKTAQTNQDPFAEASAWRALGVMYERQSAPEAASAAMAEAHRLSLSMGL